MEDMALDGEVKHQPRVITNEVDQKERCGISPENISVHHRPGYTSGAWQSPTRSEVYQTGGVLFVTSRILVVDLLTKRLSPDHVSGIIVSNAHKYVYWMCFSVTRVLCKIV